MTVLFCLPGNNFSGRFLDCYINLLYFLWERKIQTVTCRRESCNIYYVRNMCLGGDVRRGIKQKPFDGKLKYDYMVWIDSDMVFTPTHLDTLLRRDKSIIAGLYLMSDERHYAAVRNWDEEFFKKNGHFEFLNPDDVKGKKNLIEVDYTGFGFITMKHGVFESLEYPWFRPLFKQIGDLQDFCMEDVAFCHLVKDKGYKVYIDPTVLVGHEKKIILG